MVPVMSLWVPIVVSAVFVFVVSSVIHMVLRYHSNDLRRLPQEKEVMDALRPFNLPPGDYGMPHAGSMAAMKDPEFIAKMKAGPVAFLTVAPSGPPAMGSSLLLWFVYSLVVSLFAAFIAGSALPAGAPHRAVFHFAASTAFVGYALGLLQSSIWYKRNWGTTFKSMFDGLIYALVTGATFGWLWPQ